MDSMLSFILLVRALTQIESSLPFVVFSGIKVVYSLSLVVIEPFFLPLMGTSSDPLCETKNLLRRLPRASFLSAKN
jgi:hypothetical protein